MNSILNIQVVLSKSHGLEVYKVYVDGVLLSQHLSLAGANTRALTVKAQLQAVS